MPILARLSFWVPSERMDTFEAAYEKKIVPLLQRHDLEESLVRMLLEKMEMTAKCPRQSRECS